MQGDQQIKDDVQSLLNAVDSLENAVAESTLTKDDKERIDDIRKEVQAIAESYLVRPSGVRLEAQDTTL